MQSLDGYQRAAAVLREMPAEEQAWILDQLEEPDRARVGALLRAAAPAETTSGGASPATPAHAPAAAAEDDVAVIAAADFAALAGTLRAQPEWVTAIVAAHVPQGAVVRRYVNQLPYERSERIRSAANVVGAIKPNVRDRVLRYVGDRIKRHKASAAPTEDFDFPPAEPVVLDGR